MGYTGLTSKENRERHRLISCAAKTERDILKWQSNFCDDDERDGAEYMVARLNEQLTLQKKMLERIVKGITKT